MIKDFDLEQAIITLHSGQGLTGKGGSLTLLITQTTETALKNWNNSWKMTSRRTVRMAPATKLLSRQCALSN